MRSASAEIIAVPLASVSGHTGLLFSSFPDRFWFLEVAEYDPVRMMAQTYLSFPAMIQPTINTS